MRDPLHLAVVIVCALYAGACGERLESPVEVGESDAAAKPVGLPSTDGGRHEAGPRNSGDAHATADSAMPDAADSSIPDVTDGATPDASDSGDAMSAACDPTSAFGAPVAIPDLSSAGRDDGLSLSPDGLTAYLSSGRLSPTGADQIFVARKSVAADPFGVATLLAGISASAPGEADYAPRISTDGRRLYFTSYQNGSSHIYVAARADVADQFGATQLVPGINSPSATADKDEYLTPDETNLYFSSDRLGSPSLFWATTSSAGTFAEPSLIVSLAASPPADDHSPVVTADQLTIFFASNRSGNVDIWTATRASVASLFGAPVDLTALDVGGNAYPEWLSSDGCTLYFAAGPYATMHFYEATRGH